MSVRSCQKAPSLLRSYSSRLTQASNVLPSLSRMTNRQHSGTEHTSDTGTDTGAVTMSIRPTRTVVGFLLDLGHHGALAAAAAGYERDNSRGSADEHAQQAPDVPGRPSTSTSLSHCGTPAFCPLSGSRA